ncbi:MAG: LAGLIDADG family homing endonuclease [Candidatus Odinarchaeota archaeon]
MELIESLKIELQNFGEKLAEIFPERVKKLSDPNFSELWGMDVNKLKVRLRKGSEITRTAMEKLKNNINVILGAKSDTCLKLIKRFINKEIQSLDFIESLRMEIGCYFGLIEVLDEEISILLFGNPRYIVFLKQCLNNPNFPQFNPNKKLSIRKLNKFKVIFYQILGCKAKNLILMIDDYISSNPDLPEYSHQQYFIKNPHIFDEIDTVEKAYWLGFLCADGSLYVQPTNKYEISSEISSKDKSELYKLAKFVGINEENIKDRLRLVKLKDGSISLSEMSYLRFTCLPMGEALVNNGKFGSGSSDDKKRVPNVIKKLMDFNQKQSLSNSQERKIGLAWLLGYFDGDGTVYYDRKGFKLLGEIISSSKTLLQDIKNIYKIYNKIGFKDKNQGTYRLAIGPKIYKN